MKLTLIATATLAVLATTAHAAEPSSHALDLARQIVLAQAGGQDVAAIASQMKPFLVTGEISRLPPDRRTDPREMEAAVAAELTPFLTKAFDYSVRDYATAFTEAELAAAVSAPDSPQGRAVADREKVLDRRMDAEPGLQIESLVTAVVERYCARTACTPELKAALIAPAPRR